MCIKKIKHNQTPEKGQTDINNSNRQSLIKKNNTEMKITFNQEEQRDNRETQDCPLGIEEIYSWVNCATLLIP